MVCRIMERAVPFQVLNLDSVGFGDLIHIPPHEIFPRFGVVKVEPFRILTAQTNYLSPDNTVMISDTFSYSIEVNRHIELRKQSVRAELFNAGTVGYIAYQALQLFRAVGVSFRDSIEKFVGIFSCRHRIVVLIFK